MRARIITKLRKKIQSDGYIEERMILLAGKCREWNHFYRHECDCFFVGDETKYMNTLRYNKYGKRDQRKFDWYKRKFENQQ